MTQMDSQVRRCVGEALRGPSTGALSPWPGGTPCWHMDEFTDPYLGIFIEVSPCKHDQLLTHFPTPPPSLKYGGGTKSFRSPVMPPSECDERSS